MITDFLSELVTLCRKHDVIRLTKSKELEVEMRAEGRFFKSYKVCESCTNTSHGICIGLKKELVEWAEPKEEKPEPPPESPPESPKYPRRYA